MLCGFSTERQAKLILKKIRFKGQIELVFKKWMSCMGSQKSVPQLKLEAAVSSRLESWLLGGGSGRQTCMWNIIKDRRKYTKTFTEIQIQKEIHKIVHWNALTGIQIFHWTNGTSVLCLELMKAIEIQEANASHTFIPRRILTFSVDQKRIKQRNSQRERGTPLKFKIIFTYVGKMCSHQRRGNFRLFKPCANLVPTLCQIVWQLGEGERHSGIQNHIHMCGENMFAPRGILDFSSLAPILCQTCAKLVAQVVPNSLTAAYRPPLWGGDSILPETSCKSSQGEQSLVFVFFGTHFKTSADIAVKWLWLTALDGKPKISFPPKDPKLQISKNKVLRFSREELWAVSKV